MVQPKVKLKKEVTESKLAAKEAAERLRQVKASSGEINNLADSLAKLRDKNHFADLIRATVTGGE